MSYGRNDKQSKIILARKKPVSARIFPCPEYQGVTGARQHMAMLSAVTEGERLVEHERKGIVQLLVPPIPSRPFARYLRSYVDGLILHKTNLHLGTVLIATTSRCQYNCWYCNAHNTPRGDITVESIEKILDVLKPWGTSIIGFTGGERMLRKDTDEIIKRHSRDFTFMIFSSGYGLDTSRAESLKEKGHFINLVMPHQVTVKIITEISETVGIEFNKNVITLDRYGNAAAASTPIAMNYALESKRLQPGMKILLVGGAGGFSAGAIALIW